MHTHTRTHTHAYIMSAIISIVRRALCAKYRPKLGDRPIYGYCMMSIVILVVMSIVMSVVMSIVMSVVPIILRYRIVVFNSKAYNPIVNCMEHDVVHAGYKVSVMVCRK